MEKCYFWHQFSQVSEHLSDPKGVSKKVFGKKLTLYINIISWKKYAQTGSVILVIVWRDGVTIKSFRKINSFNIKVLDHKIMASIAIFRYSPLDHFWITDGYTLDHLYILYIYISKGGKSAIRFNGKFLSVLSVFPRFMDALNWYFYFILCTLHNSGFISYLIVYEYSLNLNQSSINLLCWGIQ